MDIKSYTPTDKNGKTSATQYTIVGYEDFDLQGGIADNIANNADVYKRQELCKFT